VSKKTDRQNEFVAQARTHVGYKTKTGTESYYGGLVGYQGLAWNGAFVDVVARETGLFIPACVNTTSGLAEFIRLRRWHGRPQIGDIVFYAFPTATDYTGQGHIGIVTDVSEWNRLGRIKAVEGMTDSGLPKQNIKSYDGVYERVRYSSDILGFGRPKFEVRPARELNTADGQPQIRISNLKPGKRSRDVELVQLALGIKTGLKNASRGSWDSKTSSAYAQWQRIIGYAGPDASGTPDESSLSRLARETRTFRL
jgi:hypothetical protein